MKCTSNFKGFVFGGRNSSIDLSPANPAGYKFHQMFGEGSLAWSGQLQRNKRGVEGQRSVPHQQSTRKSLDAPPLQV